MRSITYLSFGMLFVLASCATQQGAARKDQQSGSVGSTGARTAGKDGQKADENLPVINSKAKLAFEDANKAWEQMAKSGKIDWNQLDQRYMHAAEADPSLAEAVYNRGVIAEKQGNTKAAVDFYKEALERRPSLRQAAENLGVIAQNQGNEDDAARIYESILKSYPDDAASRARLAEIQRRKGQGDHALQLAREALFRDPKTLQAYKTMMQVYFEQKQYSMARLCALRASKIQGNDPEISYTLGLINLAEKEPLKARVQFKNAVASRPDFLPAHLELAKMALAHEDYGGAEESLRHILRANGKNVEALVNLGVALKGSGQYDRALEAYDQAAKVDGNVPAIAFNRGLVFAAKGDCDKAIELYKGYISMSGGEGGLDPGHGVFNSLRACEAVIAKREEDKRAAEEAAKMEAEMKKQEDAAKLEEKKKKEEELRQQQQGAKASPEAAKDSSKDGAKPAPPKGTKGAKADPSGAAAAPPTQPKAAPPQPKPAPPPEKPKNPDEPDDNL